MKYRPVKVDNKHSVVVEVAGQIRLEFVSEWGAHTAAAMADSLNHAFKNFSPEKQLEEAVRAATLPLVVRATSRSGRTVFRVAK